MKKAVTLLFLFLILPSCSSSEKTQEMDINLKKSPVQGEKKQAASGETKNISLPASVKIDWQRFFKPPPNQQERSVLTTQLKESAEKIDVPALVTRGRNQIALGQLAAAEASLRQALRLDSDNRESQLELAQLYLRQGKVTRCFEFLSLVRKTFSEASQKDADFIFRYRYTLALAYIARKESAKGHRVLSDLIELDKSFSPGYAALASSYLNLGKANVAEFIAKRGLDRGDPDASLENILGVVAKKNQKKIQAMKHFNKALSLSQNYTPAIVNRANLMIDIGELDAAESDLQKAITFNPGSYQAYIALGICQKRMGRYAAAKTSFTRAIELNPESGAARFNMGILMFDHFDRPNIALRLFHEVLQTTDQDSQLKNQAQLYIEDIRENRQP